MGGGRKEERGRRRGEGEDYLRLLGVQFDFWRAYVALKDEPWFW